jgi:hypothetical protein
VSAVNSSFLQFPLQVPPWCNESQSEFEGFSFSSRLKKKGKKKINSRFGRGGFVYVGGAPKADLRKIDVPSQRVRGPSDGSLRF